jgi:hypothetical protein
VAGKGEQEYREGFSGSYAGRADDPKRARELDEFAAREIERSARAERRYQRKLGRRPLARGA